MWLKMKRLHGDVVNGKRLHRYVAEGKKGKTDLDNYEAFREAGFSSGHCLCL